MIIYGKILNNEQFHQLIGTFVYRSEFIIKCFFFNKYNFLNIRKIQNNKMKILEKKQLPQHGSLNTTFTQETYIIFLV